MAEQRTVLANSGDDGRQKNGPNGDQCSSAGVNFPAEVFFLGGSAPWTSALICVNQRTTTSTKLYTFFANSGDLR